ncbi:hypothetical protein LCGC14_3057250 [marine sediment metagenome]|uniref:Uncharacterized protein n=1 Tax=marine sediment metagenome TaxID=412755 RepID=A0A0F8X877_9ZZZZ|nr:hypothetical protein [Bacteroides sp.]
MPSPNIEMLQSVVKGLGELKEDLVFIGGVVAELYAKEPTVSDIRPTLDVDCIIKIPSRFEYTKLEEKLRDKGLSHDQSEGAPICRWDYNGIKLDVMPTDKRILGFSNKWYKEGIENRIVKVLPDGNQIFIFQPEYYLASKFEAFKSRGGTDLRQSHDFEDIIYIIDNLPEITDTIREVNKNVKNYLKTEFDNLQKNYSLNEAIECALPYGSTGPRIDSARTKIEELANLS